MGDSERKREYINAAYRILQRDGIDGITIRKVADEVGVSSAALYKHFENIDQLTEYASVRYLSDYAHDAQMLSSVELNPLQLNIQLWECMAYYAFRDVPIFQNIFFGENAELMGKAVFDFYQYFPEELEGMHAYLATIMWNNNLFERDFYSLVRAADAGIITMESAKYLSDMDVFLFRGMLATYRDDYMVDENYRKATQRFMSLLVQNYNTQLLPGHSILTVSPLNDACARPMRSDSGRSKGRARTSGSRKH